MYYLFFNYCFNDFQLLYQKGDNSNFLPTATNANNLKVDKEIIIVIKEDGTIYCNNFIEGLDK